MIKIISFLKIIFGETATVIQELKKIPEIVKIMTLTGEYDILIEIETETSEQLSEVFLKKIDHIPGMKETHSNYILNIWEK
jgi:DNA-binding Lrp family transcriptional regulator